MTANNVEPQMPDETPTVVVLLSLIGELVSDDTNQASAFCLLLALAFLLLRYQRR
ncbi:hypothetical protein BCL76_103609 [Streptomyces sp. CG 926]|uniref:hypothetical protein n=1 Tax=Streptomyces sp. CG 926 TaxID=1882405 RepID=UPI000D7A0842|nr:hypothetical protein [Streptomyces sp. CG 926]PWK72373.1 hypothetical protein BCL76_103609 [Streptomyces sp. CG 926]